MTVVVGRAAFASQCGHVVPNLLLPLREIYSGNPT
jgi:hypothetical protein